ncbi:MAG: GH92 family glycosyl hydrolase [Chitinophagaceae bacterium]
MRLYFTGLLLLSLLRINAQQLTKFVDPFLGTGGHGHVYPGATIPFGMVQLSPDNGDEGWDWCAGYHYSSKTIAGFSHTHLSGTGIGDACDISVLPLTDTVGSMATRIKIPFDHKNESAKPGYYQVMMGNGVNVELTANERTGYHRYQFPSLQGWLRFDMGFAINWDAPTHGMLELLDPYTLVGYRYSTGWAKGQKVYFAAKFNLPVIDYFFIEDSIQKQQRAEGKKVKVALRFNTPSALHMSVSLSHVSVEKALLESTHQEPSNFDQVAITAEKSWEKELQKIKIDTRHHEMATKFYTAIYRTCLAPIISSDRDKAYKTYNNKYQYFQKGDNKFTIFSQWDVFRALHPLFSFTQPSRHADMLNSMLAFYEDTGLLPVWDIYSWEANTMTGYHTIPILADAILKNHPSINAEEAYQAMKKSAFQQQRGTQEYIQFGYLPQDKHGWSVTITLEYAYDDWCIAQVAKKLGRQEDYALFMKRARSYQNLFDPTTGFFRSKNSQGKFVEPFDPLLSEHGFEGQYIEGTAWQHSFFVPHDLPGFAQLHGGKKKLIQKLDNLFLASSELHGDNVSVDVSGLIGQYAHGNEPSHHIIYMYTALGAPEKAAYWLRVVADSMYKTGPNGLTGNDDCGQMSAWFIWTCLGMYPLNPAGGEYVFGIPLIDAAQLVLPNGKTLNIIVKNKKENPQSAIKKVTLNGKLLKGVAVTHEKLLQGGELIYHLE